MKSFRPSKEEQDVWRELDDAIQEEHRIADNLDYWVQHIEHGELMDLLEKEQQAEYLRDREENPPPWWKKLLGL